MTVDDDQVRAALRQANEWSDDAEHLTVSAYRYYRRHHAPDLPTARTIYDRFEDAEEPWQAALEWAGVEPSDAASD